MLWLEMPLLVTNSIRGIKIDMAKNLKEFERGKVLRSL